MGSTVAATARPPAPPAGAVFSIMGDRRLFMRWLWIIMVGVLCAGVLGLASDPAKAGTTQAPFAVIDMEEVLVGYEAYAQANEDFRTYFMEIEQQLELNHQLRLLNDSEMQELKDLRAAVALTPQQKARREELQGLSDKREMELNALEAKGNELTPSEKARRTELLEIGAKRSPAIAAEERRLTLARQKRNQEMSEPFNQAIKDALETVADRNGVSVIFTKDIVLWAKTDLTEEVLAELNGEQEDN